MSLIRKPNELIIQSKIKALIYGQAGMGKTTLALSAPRPLLLDFDGGVNRVNYAHQKDTVQVGTFQEALDVLKEDLSDYDTIIVDTIGKMMDFIITKVCGTSNPRIQDWGRINQEFSGFVRIASSLNKHLIFVAHRDVRKEGEDNVFVPAVREKTYSAIVTELDLLGYMDMNKSVRQITFNPTSKNDGKNTCNLPALIAIPLTVDDAGTGITNNFIEAFVIGTFNKNQSVRKEMVEKYNAVIEKIKSDISTITTPKQANDFVGKVNDYSHVGSSLQQAKTLVHAKATELGYTYVKDKGYEAKV
jgi:phage nucleotide-binding protein